MRYLTSTDFRDFLYELGFSQKRIDTLTDELECMGVVEVNGTWFALET